MLYSIIFYTIYLLKVNNVYNVLFENIRINTKKFLLIYYFKKSNNININNKIKKIQKSGEVKYNIKLSILRTSSSISKK